MPPLLFFAFRNVFMATPRTRPSTIASVASLLTAAEKKVLDSSTVAALSKATREQVEAALQRTRALRDKWRDLHAAQSRTSKRTTTATAASNRRTSEKHDLFAAGVRRLEARLAEFAGTAKAAAGGRSKPPKKARAKATRASRAGVRAALKQKTATLNESKRAAKPKAARRS